MVRKLLKGSAYLLALSAAAVLSLFTGNKGVSDYALSNKNSGGIPTALAEVPSAGGGAFSSGDGGGSAAGSAAGAGAAGAGASCGASASCDGGAGDGGGKIICTELYCQGMMSADMWRADEEFGRVLSITDPDVMTGYHAWAPAVVRVMKASPLATSVVAIFALPWAQEMAYQGGVVPTGSRMGRAVMRIGISSCRLIGKTIRSTRLVFERAV